MIFVPSARPRLEAAARARLMLGDVHICKLHCLHLLVKAGNLQGRTGIDALIFVAGFLYLLPDYLSLSWVSEVESGRWVGSVHDKTCSMYLFPCAMACVFLALAFIRFIKGRESNT